jgi:hypothetical protein
MRAVRAGTRFAVLDGVMRMLDKGVQQAHRANLHAVDCSITDFCWDAKNIIAWSAVAKYMLVLPATSLLNAPKLDHEHWERLDLNIRQLLEVDLLGACRRRSSLI